MNVAGFPVPITDPAAVRWSLYGMVRRYALPDEALAGKVWATIRARFPERRNYKPAAKKVVRAALHG